MLEVETDEMSGAHQRVRTIEAAFVRDQDDHRSSSSDQLPLPKSRRRDSPLKMSATAVEERAFAPNGEYSHIGRREAKNWNRKERRGARQFASSGVERLVGTLTRLSASWLRAPSKRSGDASMNCTSVGFKVSCATPRSLARLSYAGVIVLSASRSPRASCPVPRAHRAITIEGETSCASVVATSYGQWRAGSHPRRRSRPIEERVSPRRCQPGSVWLVEIDKPVRLFSLKWRR